MSIFGFLLIEKHVEKSAQEKVVKDLDIVRYFYNQQFRMMEVDFNIIDEHKDLGLLREYLGLDYLYWITKDNIKENISPVAFRAYSTARGTGATRIISPEQMKQIYGKNKGINIIETPKARPTDKKVLDSVMSMEYAKPFIDKNGKVEKLLVGGEFLDRNYNFIDNMVNTVFERKQYNNKPIGTITIFQGDVRIATNVLNKDGERAIGTRVSDVVYKRVIEEQGFWSSRAFVVTDWYLTAYEPIKNIDDKVIGILYVGLLERPFLSIKSAYFIALLFIVLVACVLSVILSFFLSRSIAGDMKKILITTNQIADGNLDIRIQPASDIKELNKLSEAVNNTAEKLSRREESLDITNRKLEILNKSYLDLIGFVTHELKGILSSIVMNTYLLKKGILGQLNDKQSSTINSIEKNLNYLSSTVKNFLNLSRIEKQQLELNKTSVLIKEHVFDTAIEAFKEQIKDKNMKLTNNIQEKI
jgi:two-component system NtrC family sensor kinase